MRRRLPLLLFFLTVFLGMAMAQSKLNAQETGLIQYGLKLITADSPEFTSKLGYIMGSQDLTPLQPALPFSVIVSNGGSRKIAVIGVRFQITDENDKLLQHYNYTEDIGPSLVRGQLKPGEDRLVAILRRYSDAVAHKTVNSLATDPQQSSDLNILALFSRAKAITVTLDSIAFDNGDFVGPDVGDEYSRLTQHLAAEKHVCDALGAVVPLGLAAIRETLTSLASAHESPRQDLLHWDVYTRQQVRIARSLLALLEHDGIVVVTTRVGQCKARNAAFVLRKL